MKSRLSSVLRQALVCLFLLASFASATERTAFAGDALEAGFRNPPRHARMHCYWWWLNGNTTEEAITHDLEQMKAKGYGGALLVDASGANQFGNNDAPVGPMFGTPEWRKLYRHALKEADRLGLELSLNIASGWNLGGPYVNPADASKILTFSREVVTGPGKVSRKLALPPSRNSFYQDIAVLAYPLHAGTSLPGTNGDSRKPIRRLADKTAYREVGFSVPVTTPLLEDFAPQPGEEDAHVQEVVNLTRQAKDGELKWEVPAGNWEILRVGYTDSDAKVSTASGKWQGLVIDYMDHTALQKYWDQNVAPLLTDARPYIGKTLRYLVTDSWELGGTNWTPRFRQEFQKRRGYDLLPWLPVVSGRIVESRPESNRFLNDFRKTIGELIAEEHYGAFAALAKREGLGTHPESGGPHGAPIDALRTLGMSTFPQTEYWAKSATHRSSDADRFFLKEASSAAHIYGKTLVAAEGMTSIGPQWEETIWDNLKPSFDQAICEGLNLLFWHTFTSSPKETGLPGQEYFAGTHLNPKVTWWNYAGPFVSYINRTQFLMQQGLPVADVVSYYGDHVPNFVQLKAGDPAKVLPGYDYDVTDEEALVERMSVKDGQIVLPDGMSYRVLFLGDRPNISLKALRKVRELVAAGATVVGSKPQRATGLEKDGDDEVQRIAAEVWGDCGANGVSRHGFGKGYLYCGTPVRSVLMEQQILPDFEFRSSDPEAALEYIHRRAENDDIYFVRNMKPEPVYAQVKLRVDGKEPELWHMDTGSIEDQPLYQATGDGRTLVPLWLEPYGSVAVALRSAQGREKVPTLSLQKQERQGWGTRMTDSGTRMTDSGTRMTDSGTRMTDSGTRMTDSGTRMNEYLTELSRDGKTIFPVAGSSNVPPVHLQRTGADWSLEAGAPGKYQVKTSTGRTLSAEMVVSSRTVDGGWTLHFPAGWDAPASVEFDTLRSWAADSNRGIRYFSGTATYVKQFEIPAGLLRSGKHLYLDLGEVKEIAQVTLNGRDLGVAWKKPFRICLDGAAKAGANRLEIAVTNLWPNRLIGDQQLPPERRKTHTNITKFHADSPLMPSGLLGPVRLVTTYRSDLK